MNSKEKAYTIKRIKEVADIKKRKICQEEPHVCSQYDAESQSRYTFSPEKQHIIAAMKQLGVKIISPADFIKRFGVKGKKNISFQTKTQDIVANYDAIIKLAKSIAEKDKNHRRNVIVEKGKRLARIADRVTELSDKLLLGDAKDAMKLIKEFMSQKF